MWFLIALFACAPKSDYGPALTEAPAAQQAAVEPPRLVVYLVVDQLPVALFERTRRLYTGGFARLTDGDSWVGTARYTHAVAFTCPGHATLSTGASPLVHGIVGNDWIEGGEPRYCADIANLRADTLADRIHAGGGKVASLSLKDRAALMLGGRSPDALAWYDRKNARWSEGAPAWAPTDGIARVLTAPWTARHPEVYGELFPDDQAFEEVIEPLGTTFPHPAPGLDHPGLFRNVPASGGVLTDVAIQAIDELGLGADDTADLLAVSYSQTDYIGHAFTPESWEAMDALVVLDRDLERLFDALDSKVGADRYVVALSSDHGAASGTARRIPADAVSESVHTSMHAAGLPGEIRFSDNHVYLPAGGAPGIRAEAARAVARALTAVDGVKGAWAWRADGLPEGIPAREQIAVCLDPERAGEVYVLLEEQTLFDFDGLNRGTAHGTPWDHDTVVPLLIRGPGVHPGVGGSADTRAIAPTLAALAGIERPKDAELDPIASAIE